MNSSDDEMLHRGQELNVIQKIQKVECLKKNIFLQNGESYLLIIQNQNIKKHFLSSCIYDQKNKQKKLVQIKMKGEQEKIDFVL
ncbi:unnamed protein product [Paramecium sonneborni]|uniref:Uncharacterized protein n=1 Tax=Paramecium sonneborni TaxID=65129 RepID=A0A8S1M663_9CILI|nr:unnamed protein product [Paramecium sonneborni]